MTLNESRWWRMWPTILVGLVGGLLLVPVGDWATDVARKAYDDSHPVVRADGTMFERQADEITVAISGEKLRDCEYIAIAGYALGEDGLLRSTFIRRVDQPEHGSSRPVGKQSFGVWKLWPTAATKRIEIWVSHQCSGRMVRTKVAEVAL